MCYSAQYQDLALSFVVSLGNVCSYITFHLSYFVLSFHLYRLPKIAQYTILIIYEVAHTQLSFHVKSTPKKIFTLTDLKETWFLHSVC